MKITIAIVACLIGYVMSEGCPNGQASECMATSCATDYDMHCVDRVCMCLSSVAGANCKNKDDCRNADHGNHHCNNDRNMDWECVRDVCRCVQG